MKFSSADIILSFILLYLLSSTGIEAYHCGLASYYFLYIGLSFSISYAIFYYIVKHYPESVMARTDNGDRSHNLFSIIIIVALIADILSNISIMTFLKETAGIGATSIGNYDSSVQELSCEYDIYSLALDTMFGGVISFTYWLLILYKYLYAKK